MTCVLLSAQATTLGFSSTMPSLMVLFEALLLAAVPGQAAPLLFGWSRGMACTSWSGSDGGKMPTNCTWSNRPDSAG